MQPIDFLIAEHALIERMIALMQQELSRIKSNMEVDREFAFVDPVFIDQAVDFLKTYADRGHHGKEEDILFAELARKSLSPEHSKLMQELIQEHAWGREAVAGLLKAKEGVLLDNPEALDDLLIRLGQLVEFYPRHIQKETAGLFFPCMAYFTDAEKKDMVARMAEFDRQMIHQKYAALVEGIENRKSCRIEHGH
jgi:hemerythrin-like domain-containing protein